MLAGDQPSNNTANNNDTAASASADKEEKPKTGLIGPGMWRSPEPTPGSKEWERQMMIKEAERALGLVKDESEAERTETTKGEPATVEQQTGPAASAASETEREALSEIKVPETLIIDRKILLRPDRCPCTLCRWFLYEVSQQVERIGTTSLEAQADMLRDSCPLLALAMSKDHRSSILWDIGWQQYQDKKYLKAAQSFCWSMSAGEGGVGGYFRLYDLQMLSEIYTNDKVRNTNYGKLLRAVSKTKIASFYGMKRHPEHMCTLMHEAYQELSSLLSQFEDARDKSVIRYNMLKITHCINNYQRNRQSYEMLAAAYKLWEENAEEDWSYLPAHKWMAEEARAKVRWMDAEAMYRVCSYLTEADNQYSADFFFSMAYSTVKRLLGGGGKTQDGAVIPAGAPVQNVSKAVIDYITEVMKVGMHCQKITCRLFGNYDALIKLENLPFNAKQETLDFLAKYKVTVDEPKPAPFPPDVGPDGKAEMNIDDINLQIPQITFCSYCFSEAEKLKKCKNCEQVKYCGPECQKKHWSEGNHKKFCKLLGSAAKFPKISL